jgi:chorismate dehydratase
MGGRAWDAAVTIGDKSFRPGSWPYLDLGTEWRAMTGKPFVYALWAHQKNHPRAAEIRRVLRRSKEVGQARIAEIARRESKRVGKSEEFCRRYLTEYITFDLGPEERAGLRLFGRLA